MTAYTAKLERGRAPTEDAGRVRTVAAVVSTNPGSSAGVNLDVLAADLGGWSKIRRYTVTLHWGVLRDAPAGTDMVFTNNCVVDDLQTVCRQLTVDASDPNGKLGVSVDPYAGVNSFITIMRGADGLGPVDVFVNAYIEVEQ